MPNTTQTIGPLIGGVSQTPSHMRPPQYATELLNALAHPALGTTRRPGTRHIALLDNSADDHYENAALFPFNAGDKRRYILSVAEGDLRIVEADTGVERNVSLAAGAIDYISGTLDPLRPFAGSMHGDTMYLVNRAKVAKMGNTLSAARAPEAVVAVRAADFGTTYTVKLDGAEASYKTPDGTDASVRALISTDLIAEKLALSLTANSVGLSFTITRSGSAIHLRRADGGNFSISIGDGLADAGLSLAFGSISSALDLPPTGVVDGFTVRVVGSPATAGDDFWMEWKAGVWQECARPGSPIELDATTMPHALTLGGALHDGLIVPPAPPAPGVQEGGVVEAVSWFVFALFGGASGGSFYLSTSLVGAQADSDVLPSDGSTGTIEIDYDIETLHLSLDKFVSVELYRVSGGVETLIDNQDYPSFYEARNRRFSVNAVFAVGDSVRVKITTGTDLGFDPDTPEPEPGRSITDVVTMRASATRFIPDNSSQAAIPGSTVYPEGAVVTVSANATPISHTVASGGETGVAIATAIAAAWAVSGVTCVDTGDGRLILRQAATPPTMASSCTFDLATHLWLPDGALTPAALVGERVVNRTTGAEGTVTSNTAKLIVFSALSGGSSSELRPGDFIRIAAAEDTFAFAPVAWEARTAGDSESNAPPSFIGRTIDNVGVAQNRLVLTAGEYVVASAAGKVARFFRTTTQQVLDSDPIDVRASASRGLPFWHMVEWNEKPHLFNGRDIYVLDGDPLGPRSVGLPHVFQVNHNERVSPVVVGRHLYIARSRNGFTQILALASAGESGVDSIDATEDVPKYLVGEPVAFTSDAESPFVLITELSGTRYVYAMQPVSMGNSVSFAWAQWQFDPGSTPLAVTMNGGDLILLVSRADGVYLEALDTLAHLE